MANTIEAVRGYIINSEYDVIDTRNDSTLEIDWDNPAPELQTGVEAMRIIGDAFRNWTASRAGGAFTQSRICWPSPVNAIWRQHLDRHSRDRHHLGRVLLKGQCFHGGRRPLRR